jgi:hypothetical protein
VSHFSTQGISVHVYQPTYIASPWQWVPRGQYVGRLDNLLTYSHKIEAWGGFTEASFSIAATTDTIEDWLLNGLGRDVTVYNPGGSVVWEGFVNTVKASTGGYAISRGPLLDVVNEVLIKYTRLDTSTFPNLNNEMAFLPGWASGGTETLYGILAKIFTIGSATDAMAAQMLNRVKLEYRHPPTSKQWASGGGGVALAVDCVGYISRLDYPYPNSLVFPYTAGTENINVKLGRVLDEDPNRLFSSVTAQLMTNAIQVTKATAFASQRGLDMIKGMVAVGDSAYNRCLFGVYENRIPYYYQAPTAIEYRHRLEDTRQVYRTVTGIEVDPWDMRPGKWLLFEDFLATQPVTAALDEDPRAMFIESVSYNADGGLQLTGGREETPSTRLIAQMGLSGSNV